MKRLVRRFVPAIVSFFVAVNMLFSPAVSAPVVMKTVKMFTPASQQYDGKLLYQQAFENIRDNHLGLLSPSARQKWVKAWENRFHANWLQRSGNADRAIAQMLESMKFQHDNYFPPADWAKQLSSSQGLTVGLGARFQVLNKTTSGGLTALYTLSLNRNLVVADKPVPGSPAEIAGLAQGDIVLFVNGQKVDGKVAQDVIDQINGSNANTSVRLTVKRGSQSLSFTMKRAVVSHATVTFMEVNKRVAYIHQPDFESELIESEMKAALAQATNYDAVIYDLRKNPGGRMEAAIEIFAQMSETGTALVVRERSSSQILEQTYKVTSTEFSNVITADGKAVTTEILARANTSLLALKPQVKLIVLIDEESASASEIMAGALKANKRAIIIGVKSFGKDVGQSVYELSFNRGISVTSFEFLPGGVSMNRTGINPDIVVVQKGPGDRQFERAVQEALKP